MVNDFNLNGAIFPKRSAESMVAEGSKKSMQKSFDQQNLD
jgi:hypothetical protein